MTAHTQRTEEHTEAPSVLSQREFCRCVANGTEGERNLNDHVVRRAGARSENKHVRGERAITSV